MNNQRNYELISRFVHICVVCWGKLGSASEMSAHRTTCKMQANGKPTEPGFQPGSVAGRAAGKLNNGGSDSFSDSKSNEIVDVDTDQEVTKLVTTPDIQCYEDMDGPDTPSNGTSSKASSPPPLAVPMSSQPPRPPSISNSLHNSNNNQTTAHVAAAAHAAASAAQAAIAGNC